MAVATKQTTKQAPQRTTFAMWLYDEMRGRDCAGDRLEFARRYGFDHTTVWRWLHGKLTPSPRMCREIADMLDLTVVEVMCAAGHLHWSDIDDYCHAYAEQDALDNWATTGDL